MFNFQKQRKFSQDRIVVFFCDFETFTVSLVMSSESWDFLMFETLLMVVLWSCNFIKTRCVKIKGVYFVHKGKPD